MPTTTLPGNFPVLPTVAATYGGVPNYTNLATTQSGNIASLLSPDEQALADARRRGAEAAVGGGFSGSGFEDLNTLHMTEDEKLRRQLLGSQMLTGAVGQQTGLQAANLGPANLGERQEEYWQNRQDVLNQSLYGPRNPILGAPTSPGVARVGGAPAYAAPGSRGTMLPSGNPLLPAAPNLPMYSQPMSFGALGVNNLSGGSGVPIWDQVLKQYAPWATPSGEAPGAIGRAGYDGNPSSHEEVPQEDFGVGPVWNDPAWNDLGINPATGLYA